MRLAATAGGRQLADNTSDGNSGNTDGNNKHSREKITRAETDGRFRNGLLFISAFIAIYAIEFVIVTQSIFAVGIMLGGQIAGEYRNLIEQR